ncbi:MAG TPA: MG2 domain-containing protein [Candidatus Bathyarchaeia archaeon]|nr:MG2 domain-containing protein [Candidatus Bathyarchaeia archaeon]
MVVVVVVFGLYILVRASLAPEKVEAPPPAVPSGTLAQDRAGETPAPQPAGETPAPQPAGETPAPQLAGETPAPQPAGETPAPQLAGETPAPQPAPQLQVVEVSPPPGSLIEGSIKIRFSEPIQLPPEAAGASPLTISPPLDGEALLGSDFIVYRIQRLPAEPRTYTVEVNPLIQTRDGRRVDHPMRYLFKNSNRIVQRVWEIDATTLGMMFASEIAPEAVQSHLEVWEKDQLIPATVEAGETPQMVRIKIPSGLNENVEAVLKGGLTDVRGNVLTATDVSCGYTDEPPLSVTKLQWERYSWDEQRFRLAFSAPVRGENLAKALKVTDPDAGAPVPYNLDTYSTASTHTVYLDSEGAPPAKIVVEISGDLVGENREHIIGPYRGILAGRELKIEVQNTYWQAPWRERDGMSLRLFLTGRVDVAEMRKALAVDPLVENFRVEGSGNMFRIFGNWDSGASYRFTIKSGLRDRLGSVLQQDLEFDLVADQVPGYVGFAGEGLYYFPRRTGMALPIETRNIDKVEVKLYRMFPGNIAVAVNDMDEGSGSYDFDYRWSAEVAKTEVAATGRVDRLASTPLDVDALFPQDKLGVFLLKAEGKGTRMRRAYREQGDGDLEPQEYTITATKIVVWTGMGALAHWESDELAVFVHDLYSLEPLATAKVTVYSTKNQELGSANTDAQGIAHLRAMDKMLGEPRVAVIEREGDYTFLDLRAREDGRDALDEQMPPYKRDGYDAFIYADRELYRPGETVHAHWLVRTNYGDCAPNVPLVVTVVRPNGRNLLSEPTVLSDMGTGGLDIATEKVFQTGKYTVQLTVPGNSMPIGSYQFSLEEFVPNRIKTEVKLAETRWLSAQSYPIVVNAQHLFGAPASDRKAEALVIFRRGEFKPENWKEYKFDNDSRFLPEPVQCGEARTNPDGEAAFTFSYTAPAKASFPMKALVVGRVFELGGRPVSSMSEATFFPSDLCLGIATTKPAAGEGVEVLAAAVKSDGTPAELDKVTVTLEREVWNYYVRRYYSHHEPNWSETFEPVESQEVPLTGGKGSVAFNPQGWGYYRVRVHCAQTPQFSTVSFYNYGGECRVVAGARPSLIKLSLDKKDYAPGDEAVVRIESPFDGKGVVVVQGEEIQDVIPVDIRDKVGETRIALSQKQCPNVWIEATVIHAVQEDRRQVYPFSSFAMANVRVLDPKRRLDVELPALPEEIRPKTTAQFQVSVHDSEGSPAEAELTLAAVDEGIHLITGYQSPKPYEHMLRPRQPDFRRAHYYDKVAYDFDKPQIGGDALLRDLQKRLPSVDENWIKPVALWSGVVRTDATGLATVTMDVPEYTGQLRLVAVACTPRAVGAQSADLYVRRPYMLRASMPRFMLPGDVARCRAVVFNNTDAPCKADVTWSSGGTIASGGGSGCLEVPAHGENVAIAEFTAAQAVGQGEIRWQAVVTDSSGAEVERLEQVAPMPVRAPASFQSRHEMIVLKPGESREIKNTVFLDDQRTEMDLTVGGSPLLRLEKALEYVAGYPYGCVEQTTSRLLPMYLLRKNQSLMPSVIEPNQIDAYIKAGIGRLFLMQTPGGGLSFWPGSYQAYDYGSVYGLHFLTLVKNGREFELPEQNLDALEDYVRGIAFNPSIGDESRLFVRAYAIYVLALGGDLKAVQQIQRFDAITMPRHASYLLAAALAQNTQDVDRVKMYLAKAPKQPYTIQETDRSLNSEIRNTAIELLALVRMNTDPAEANSRAQTLVDFLAKRHYGTTQESAFIITALVEYLEGISEGLANASAQVTAPDREETLVGDQVGRFNHTGPGGTFTVANTGSTDVYVNLTVGGVPQTIVSEQVSEGGIGVTRTRLTSTGDPFVGEIYTQGDSYVVNLSVQCDRQVKNVVLVDMLPAGFEIENPRLDVSSLPGGKFSGAVTPSYLDVRDDRIIAAFDALDPGLHQFYYVVRAVTPGNYDCPAATAECMYDPSVVARTASGSIEVKQN